jgi:hypothetical protein
MPIKGIRVKVVDVNNSFISYRYLSSNARSRIKKAKFIKEYQEGVFNVVNPDALEID